MTGREMVETLRIVNETGRLDRVLAGAFDDITRSQAQKWIAAGLVQVNGKAVKVSYQVQAGDSVSITRPEPEPLAAEPEDIPLEIIYEDESVIVVNKPQGMVVHPAPGHSHGTLVNALLAHSDFSAINDVIRPGIVHRIDKDTSGLLMVAKTPEALASLQAQLKAKTTERTYLAIAHGRFKELSGTVDAPLGRDPKNRQKQAIVAGGRAAVTHYEVLETFAQYSLVRCRLETGRTHQIRVHMASIGHPLADDPVYGPRVTLPGHGQYLHAQTLGFKHPVTGDQLQFSVDPPEIFEQTLANLRNGVDKTRRVR